MPTYERPFRLRVLDGMTAVLQSITPANGYVHDLSECVFRGRAVFGPDDPLPLVSILETPVPPDFFPTPEGGTAKHGDWDLLVQGFVKDDPAHPTDLAYPLLAEVKQALAREGLQASRNSMDGGNNIFGMKGKVVSVDVGPGTVRPADDISATTYFWLRVSLNLVEDISKPFD